MSSLAKLPYSTTAKRMYSRVAPVYENSYFAKWFYEALGSEWDIVRHYFETLKEQSFVGAVTWGIEYLEHKYSVEPDPKLSLEERRARLFIKTLRKYPLNPEVIERQAAERFDFICTIDESDPGYIHVIASYFTEEAWNNFTEYIYSERPAHLALDWKIEHEYEVGGYDEDDYGFVHVRGNTLRVGFGEYCALNAKIYPAPPRNDLGRITSGGGVFATGTVKGGLPLPKQDNSLARFIGGIYQVTGNILIKCNLNDLLTHSDVFETAIANRLIADLGIARP